LTLRGFRSRRRAFRMAPLGAGYAGRPHPEELTVTTPCLPIAAPTARG